jgi:hypothetical protein
MRLSQLAAVLPARRCSIRGTCGYTGWLRECVGAISLSYLALACRMYCIGA